MDIDCALIVVMVLIVVILLLPYICPPTRAGGEITSVFCKASALEFSGLSISVAN